MAEKIALGTVQLGLAYGANNTVGLPSEQEAADIVRLAAGAGVAMLDTAHGYGLSEERIGLALQTLPAGERPWVVTKVDAACNDAGSPEEAAAIVEAGIQTSRARLQVARNTVFGTRYYPEGMEKLPDVSTYLVFAVILG